MVIKKCLPTPLKKDLNCKSVTKKLRKISFGADDDSITEIMDNISIASHTVIDSCAQLVESDEHVVAQEDRSQFTEGSQLEAEEDSGELGNAEFLPAPIHTHPWRSVHEIRMV